MKNVIKLIIVFFFLSSFSLAINFILTGQENSQYLTGFLYGNVFATETSSNTEKENNKVFDFSGVEQFMNISSILEDDREPSPEEWNKLFNTPGYQVLTEGEFKKEFFVEYFKLVFMPSKSDELEKALRQEEGQAFHTKFLQHYVQAKEMRKEIQQQINKLKTQAPTIIENASNEASKYLPPMEKEDFIPISFVIFANDARGYTPVVIDVLFSIELDDMLHILLAHELHHYYRNQILAIDRQEVSKEHMDIIWVLDQIHCEGVADQIDKRKLVSSEEGPLHFFSDQWEEMVENAPEYITTMDELFNDLANLQKDKNEVGQQMREKLPMSGHPIGFYMTNIIIEQLGKDILIEVTANPFAFFRLYNNAAKIKADNTPYFSEKTMKIISGLESKYIKKEEY